MHRLFTIITVIISLALSAHSADARPHFRTWDDTSAGKSTPKLLESATKGKVFKARAKAKRLRRARNVQVQWKPGFTSRNVRIMSFSFGVEREMKESGEKGGTEDINIGVGELQECTISKSMDAASSMLAQLARTRRPLPLIVLSGRDASGRYMTVKLKNARIARVRTTGSSQTIVINYTGLE